MQQPKLIIILIVSVLAVAGAATAQRVSAARHPNLAAAQRFCEQAIAKTTAAQEANEFDMSGHAKKAKTLLDEAYSELKLAAQAANRR